MRLSHGLIPTMSSGTVQIDGYTSSADVISDPISLKHVYGYSVTVSFPTTGTPVGTFTLEACNDIESPNSQPYYSNLSNWVTVANSSTASSAAVAISPSTLSSITWNYSNTMYRFLRVKYTRTSGSITLTERVQIKAGE